MKRYLLEHFERIPYFTLIGFMQMAGVEGNDVQRARELLSRWKQGGHIITLKRGVYMTLRFYELHRNEAAFTPAVSTILLPQSYVSLEYVLQRAGVLTEVTYPVSAVTTKNTRTIQNDLGTFVFRHIQPAFYTGFSQDSFHGIIYHLASVSKALFDYLYLRPLARPARTRDFNLAEDLRLNLDDWPGEAREAFAGFVESSGSEKMRYIFDNLRRNVWQT